MSKFLDKVVEAFTGSNHKPLVNASNASISRVTSPTNIGAGAAGASKPNIIVGAGGGGSFITTTYAGGSGGSGVTVGTSTVKGNTYSIADIHTRLETIEKRLNILVPDPNLLEKYEALKEAYSNYKTLEALLCEPDNG